MLQTDMKIKFHRKLSVQVLVYLYVREIFWQNWIVYTEKLFRVFVSYCRSKEKWILFVFLHIFGVVIHFIVKPFWIFCRQEETTRIARMFCAREIQNCFKSCQGLLCHEHVYMLMSKVNDKLMNKDIKCIIWSFSLVDVEVGWLHDSYDTPNTQESSWTHCLLVDKPG